MREWRRAPRSGTRNTTLFFIPKCRRKTLYAQLRHYRSEVFRKLAEQKESRIEEGHLLPDHVHMMISIPPRYAVSQVVGYIKGKSAIHLARTYGEHRRNFVGESFWARGYFVSAVGRDEEATGTYNRNQEREDQRLEQMNLWRNGRFSGRLNPGSRQRFLPAALSGQDTKAPDFAGGYLRKLAPRLGFGIGIDCFRITGACREHDSLG